MDAVLSDVLTELAALRAEVEASRARIAELEAAVDAAEPSATTNTEPTSRRAALRLAAGTVAGAAGAMLASSPAAADDPNDITLGQNKSHSGGVTRAGNTSTTDEMAFLFVAGSQFIGSASFAPAALGGWTSQAFRPNGVFGFTDQNGNGVVGMCRANQTPVLAPTRNGVFGWTDVPTRAGVFGESVSAGPGVRGDGDIGVRGIANSGGIGVEGIATGAGLGGQFVSLRAGIALYEPTFGINSRAPYGTNPPSFGTRNPGELLYTSSSTSDEVVDQGLWVCVEPGDPGSWRCLAGPESAGTLFPITPFRAYDSRRDMTPDPDGIITSGTNRTFSTADARDANTGTITNTDVIPERARAVAVNLTVTRTTGDGFLFLAPGGTTTISASTINWSPDSTGAIANASIVRLDDQRRLTIFCDGAPDASTHYIVDITGYYL